MSNSNSIINKDMEVGMLRKMFLNRAMLLASDLSNSCLSSSWLLAWPADFALPF